MGGGTGSLLEISQLERILSTLSQEFSLSHDCEITLEGNASDITKEKAVFIANSLINRISLGAQSFQPEVLKVIGAPHKAQQTIDVIKTLQEAGIENIQLDMMYNMPSHTTQHWEKDFKVLYDLNIKHLTTYLYRITPGTQQHSLIQAGKVPPVAEPESISVKEMQQMIRQFASDVGMNNYMYEHYALPSYESKYNHWTMKECVDALGIGPGAYSFINQRRTGISKDIEKYSNAVLAGKNTFTTAGIPLSLKLSKQRYMIFNLLYYQIDKKHYQQIWKSNCLEDFKDIFDILIRNSLLIDVGEYFVATETGKNWLQNMMLEFFDDSMWENSQALKQQQSSWAMNNHMIDIGAAKKDFWLARV
ncbi:coproporphyrinogen-III oxidase family protein [Bartonella pachyuromydis]|uniref:coproporphyrinogen-III oxidase family protein n=1 Tax=Bartonella pachyuromydis TaxID=931097 RepID=UPI0031EF03F1